MRIALVVFAVIGCLAGTGCASRSAAVAATGDELPAGDGRGILVRECLNCHELEALSLFSGFYDQSRWRSLIMTMRENGAVVDDDEVEVLAEYLSQHFGTGS